MKSSLLLSFLMSASLSLQAAPIHFGLFSDLP